MKTYKVIPPEDCSWDAAHLVQNIMFGGEVDWLIPDDLEIVPMGFISRTLMGGTPAYTTGKIHVNSMYPHLSGETLVHEYVHSLQRKRMGAISYDATYCWQIGISLFKVGPSHIHDNHLMEREARRIAQEVIAKCYVKGQPLDIRAAVLQVTGW
jgi:hypothetical protein